MSLKSLVKDITYPLRVEISNKKWRKRNAHNLTTVANLFPLDKVSVGKGTYGSLCVRTYANESEKLQIGNWCSIAADVVFVLGGEHNYQKFSTYPFNRVLFKEQTATKGKIIVEDDVWIGYGSVILSGVTIGRGGVIAAGSVIAKDVPPYAIVSNGRIIKYRFSEDVIKKLMTIDFYALNQDEITHQILENVTSENIDEIIRKLRK